jgi:glucose-induced degradation protein 8
MSSSTSTINPNTNNQKEPKETKKTISREEWDNKLKEVAVDKDDLNKLVMNYLVIEGYKDAAEKFSVEAGVNPKIDLSSIQDRMNIRHSIQGGRIEEAISIVNDLDPEVRFVLN